MLWDCGHIEYNKPSDFLPAKGIHTINRFFVTNYDEDHISDLPALRQKLNIELLYRNKSVSKEQLRVVKLQSGPISTAMGSMLDMIGTYTGSPTNDPEFPRIAFKTYYNEYLTDFDDTNNISLVTFIDCNGKNFVIPGDLERPGWEKLLKKESFRQHLKEVEVFIASHHGRENGYCREVFDFCAPEVVIFSDSSVKYATQEMASKYASHAKGITLKGQIRYVLSTRNDGEIYWNL